MALAATSIAPVSPSQKGCGGYGGKVRLDGKVKAWSERRLVERAAWAAPGVTQVEDNLKVG